MKNREKKCMNGGYENEIFVYQNSGEIVMEVNGVMEVFGAFCFYFDDYLAPSKYLLNTHLYFFVCLLLYFT